MTTIAYRDGVLAADTRGTSGDTIINRVIKIAKVGKVLAGTCGTSSLAREFRAWLGAGAKGEPPANPHPANAEWSYWALVVTPDRVWQFQESGVVEVLTPYTAMGSGRDFALGAMAHGATAEQAVRAAIAHDSASGGEITVLRR